MAKWIEVIDDEYGRKNLVNIENIIRIEEHEHKGIGKTMILFNYGLPYTKHLYWVTYNVKRKKKKLLYRKLNRKLQER